ncbi:MAG: hypothetical protein V4850_23675 [Myxococcota bacterium]
MTSELVEISSDYACVHDASTVEGLKRLVREQPDDWIRIVRDGVQRERVLHAEITVSEALRAGAFSDLLPDATRGLNRMLKHRTCAGLIIERLGERRVANIGGSCMRELEDWLVTTPRPRTDEPLSSTWISRVLSVARRAIRDLQDQCGVRVLLRARAKAPTKARGRTPPRTRVTEDAFAAVVRGGAPAKVRFLVGLAGACGMWPSEMSSLRAGDLRLQYREVWYDNGSGVLRASLPSWLLDIAREAFPTLDQMDRHARLFPRRGAPDEGRSSSYREVSAACRVAGVSALSLADFRRLFQEVALSRGLVSSMVRGTFVQAGPGPIEGRQTSALEDLVSLAREWTDVGRPPYGTVRAKKSPNVKRPAGVGPLQMETDREAKKNAKCKALFRRAIREAQAKARAAEGGTAAIKLPAVVPRAHGSSPLAVARESSLDTTPARPRAVDSTPAPRRRAAEQSRGKRLSTPGPHDRRGRSQAVAAREVPSTSPADDPYGPIDLLSSIPQGPTDIQYSRDFSLPPALAMLAGRSGTAPSPARPKKSRSR